MNDTVTIVYGAGGAGNGATAPAETGLSYFDVYVGPSYSHADNEGIGSAEVQDTEKSAKIPNPPFVSVQSQAGTGTVTITAMKAVGDELVAVANDRTINAGQKGALVFTFTATGDMNGGAFSVTVDNSWPNPTPDNTSVMTTGSTGNLIPRQKELIVPIVSLSATQTITVTYGGTDKDHRVTAPGVPEAGSVFTFKTRSTPTGTFVAIPDTSPSDQDPRNFEVKVTQAADGSGKVTLPVAQRTVSAGSTGNTFEITYTAVGQMNGGKIQLEVPVGDGDTWTPLSRDNLTVQGSGLAVGEFSNNDRTVTYPITTLGKGDTVKFTYTGVEVQSTVSGDSDRNGVAGPEPKKVPLKVSVSGSKDAPLVLVGDAGEAMITVDNAADGSGTATIEFSSTNFSPIENDDVPANLEVDIAIKYTAIGDVSGADIVVDNPDNALKADPGLVSLELTIPVAFTLPQTDDAADPGYIEVSGGGGSGANLELFGRIVRVKNVLLARGSVITINYRKVLTPPARGNHPFTIRSQGRKDTKNTDATDKDDRHLVALSAGSPQVTIGPVISGSGSAEIVTPELTGDPPELHKFIAGKPGATIQFEFTVPGRLDGGDVKLRAPAGWVAPGRSSGSKGYTTVFPSSGVRIGSLVFDSTEASVVIPIIEMGKDDKLTITYGAGGGASGVDVPQVAGDHQFVVETITRGGVNSIETFETVAKDEAAENKLKITATALEGSGTFTPSPDNVPVTITSAPRTARLTFTYKAEGNINTIGVTTPANWPTFKHPSSTESNGRVTVSRGELSGVTAEASAGNTIISVNKLNLTENDIVTITYDVTTPTVVGPGEFRVTSGSSESGGGSPAEKMTVYVVSEDGSGKVASTDNDVAAVTSSNLNAVIGSDRRAGDKGDLVFFYNLASGEYIRSGELQITVPSTWSTPLEGQSRGEAIYS